LCALLLLIPAAEAGTRDAPEVSDPRGDVTIWPSVPARGPVADAADLVAAWIEDWNATGMTVYIQVAGLSGIEPAGAVPTYSAQYALVFNSTENPEGFQVMAMRGGSVYTGNPLGAWRYGGYDLGSMDWTELEGSVDAAAGLIRIDVPASFLRNETTASHFRAAAWINTAYGDPQWNDWAESDAVLTIAVPPAPVPEAEAEPQAQAVPGALWVAVAALALVALRRR
jgi:hypothetical protein